MTIAILPARLANQIAAGEVVERPSSVVKELIENSLDAGATKIIIDIEKGGAKRIRITDDGCGIIKDELTLALSRHATSKIKNLDDLEAISSLGFRGEALASISSVARLTLTSKPAAQETAWQAFAEGREMNVVVQPAAHPDGTSIDVVDLFFNTPARRKFLRTEKTEFSHIEEVIKRITLARFDVSFTLNHNGKLVKHYRAINDKSQSLKRIASVFGQQFVENAIAVECQHDDIYLWGWLANPSIARKQNDLCYSYVNGRMMRDKLINHAIRQAYGEYIDNDNYPAFVLFLELDFKEVDVNVHPAKHEVRFHQGRYVHDFIYSVCQKALSNNELTVNANIDNTQDNESFVYSQQTGEINKFSAKLDAAPQPVKQDRSYVAPLRNLDALHIHDKQESAYQTGQNKNYYAPQSSAATVTKTAQQSYQNLITPLTAESLEQNQQTELVETAVKLVLVQQAQYAVFSLGNCLRVCSIAKLAAHLNMTSLEQMWSEGLVSQPLLLPVRVKLTAHQVLMAKQFQQLFEQTGVVIQIDSNALQIRQFPAILRAQDVTSTFAKMLNYLAQDNLEQLDDLCFHQQWLQLLAQLMSEQEFSFLSAQTIFNRLENIQQKQFTEFLQLNSYEVDLTSAIAQLTSQKQ